MLLPVITDPWAAALIAGLHYVCPDEIPGIRRKRAGKGFAYHAPDGTLVRDRAILRRIKAMAIPPAWTEVWICPDPDGHIQAVGRDARKNKQYRYHAEWCRVRGENKFNRLQAFGEALPLIRKRMAEDLTRPGLPREKVIALVVALMQQTLIRVGNEVYARSNDSYGLTTIRDDHVRFEGNRAVFEFRGKSGKNHEIGLEDKRLARLVKECQDLPGQALFQYVTESGEVEPIASNDVNEWLQEATGQDFTAKDFRTWGGTVRAISVFHRLGRAVNKTEVKKKTVQCIKMVSQQLGNNPATCKKFYIHPLVFETFARGELPTPVEPPAGVQLHPEEMALLVLLRTHLQERLAA